jgi:hypothetical protein
MKKQLIRISILQSSKIMTALYVLGSVAEFVGKGSEDLMFSHIGWRAYSQERGESVTRGDRRQREQEFESSLPPLARSCEYDGAGW